MIRELVYRLIEWLGWETPEPSDPCAACGDPLATAEEWDAGGFPYAKKVTRVLGRTEFRHPRCAPWEVSDE